MGNLSNLYISQSYISLIHLGSDNTASATSTELQDGLGNGIGVSVNTDGGVSASNLAITNNILAHRGLEASGTIKFNTEYTSSTPFYVNSGNQYTDNIIRVTGSYDSGSLAYPSINEVQNGWIANGPGINNAIVTNATFIPATGWEFTIDTNTAVWFGEYKFTDPISNYDNVSISGSEDITGSLWVRDNITATNISASNAISASDLWVQNTIHAYKLDVTIESSSIIFTSGSNIIGDNANEDTQTLIGRVKVSGSLEVTGSTRINGNVDSTGSLKVTSDISSSTLNGIGNVTLYSTSVNSRVSALENFSASQYKTDSASFESQILTNSASFAAYSSSLVATFATNAFVLAQTASLSASIYLTDATQSNNIATLTSKTGSYVTSGSNTFVGNQIITGSLEVTGSMVYSGSVRGQVNTLSIVSNTASMDCSLGNFFTLTLPTSSVIYLNPTNIKQGETLSLLINQASVTSSITYPSTIKFAYSYPYLATTTANGVDILTFISFDSSTLYGTYINRLV
jgi:hypothetical protein